MRSVGSRSAKERENVPDARRDAPLLPAERPRYLMGVGKPEDLIGAVARGIDLFDCVLPTRSGRTGQAFTRFGPVNLRNARHAEDPRPLDDSVPCPASREYSRAYLHHLVRSGEILGSMLLSWHNVAYYQHLMAGMRQAIVASAFARFRGGLFPRVRARRCRALVGEQVGGCALTPTLSRGRGRTERSEGKVSGPGERRERDVGHRESGADPAWSAGADSGLAERGPAGNRAEPHPDVVYLVRFTCPEFDIVPRDRPAGFRTPGDRLSPKGSSDREQVSQALSREFP